MYNETYHPLEGANLKDVLDGMTDEEKRIAMDQVAAATALKTRNYRVTIVQPEGDYQGMYFDVQNGIVTGSSDLGRK
jgi:hypothetical protein